MGIEVPMIVVTLFWGAVGGLGPFLVPKNCDRGLVRTMLVLTAVCCYTFWLVAYLCQLNPLFGPRLDAKVIVAMQREWEGK